MEAQLNVLFAAFLVEEMPPFCYDKNDEHHICIRLLK